MNSHVYDSEGEASLRERGFMLRRTPHIGPRGFLRFFILRLLKEKPQSGYDIMKELSERTDGAWSPSSGAIYPTLMEMEDQNLIEEARVLGKEELSERGRKVYRITGKGEESMKHWEEGRQQFLSSIAKWRMFWRRLWEPTLEETVNEIQELISTLDTLIKETPKEKTENTKKMLEEACQKLDTLSRSM